MSTSSTAQYAAAPAGVGAAVAGTGVGGLGVGGRDDDGMVDGLAVALGVGVADAVAATAEDAGGVVAGRADEGRAQEVAIITRTIARRRLTAEG